MSKAKELEQVLEQVLRDIYAENPEEFEANREGVAQILDRIAEEIKTGNFSNIDEEGNPCL